MHSNKIEAHKKELKLTDYQRELVVGKLLGDGHLESRDGRIYRLKIEHSLKQKEYVDWFYQQLKLWVGTEPKSRIQQCKFPQGTSGEKACYGFNTYSHGAFRFYDQQFYTRERKKIIPKLISKLLTPVSIAIWYLDDGSVKSNRHRTYIIHSHGYTREDLRRIQTALAKFGIKTTLHRQNRVSGLYWRIYVLSESAPRFKEIIEPIVIQVPSMKYKLGNILPKK